ncbi:D-alanine--D-alanine ligase [Parvularcula dongshanensis]|uniref:D-alanine--D-alanine ligase n=1 Tax=Parvularcula dongshanensis TaxID=1173995 RepID=A0A840I6C9_9PROT|nr:D-alanine--D-alanine ligase [Parvularcula dongshanensis]MBB4659865.1 D-alanine-D-alanine ligase [Parvularcula dongshanensis]
MTKRVAVLMGGWGAERGVSLVSGGAAADALEEQGFAVERVDVTRDLAADLRATFGGEGPEVVFNALHGPFGEDGTVQGMLEIMGLPYTHSGVLASAACMHKQRAKAIMHDAGLPVPGGKMVPVGSFDGSHPLPVPYVVKPVGDGSSFGVHIVKSEADSGPHADLLEDSLFHGLALVEPFIPGRELTVACIGDEPLAVTEIIPTAGFYDYAAKYQAGGSRHVVPAELPEEITATCLDMAAQAARALGCRGVSRTDFRWDDENGVNGLFILEVNTQPGLTPTSLAPEQAAYKGMSFGDLVRWMVEDASCLR